MTAEERIEQLEAENAALREQLAEALEKLEQTLGGIHELEGQRAKDSHNSSKPPSSDGPGRMPRSHRQRSEKRTGGNQGMLGTP
jgi:transposase